LRCCHASFIFRRFASADAAMFSASDAAFQRRQTSLAIFFRRSYARHATPPPLSLSPLAIFTISPLFSLMPLIQTLMRFFADFAAPPLRLRR
jgi:hypothetical protein